MGQTVVAGMGTGAVYAVFAVGLVLVFKTSGILNFAQAEIGTFGTFVTWWLVVEHDVPWALGALAGLAAAVAIGLGAERFVFRALLEAPRTTVVVATVALTLFLGALELKLWGASPALLPPPVEGDGLEIAGVVLAPTRLFALGLAVVVCAGLWVFLRSTTFGLGLLAVGQNPTAVRLSGIRLRHLSATTWGLSAALGAAASLVVAPTLGAFTPFFLSRLLLFGFAAAVIGGGLTSLPGAVVGGLALGVWEAYVARELPSLAGVVDASVFLLLAAALLDRTRRPTTRVAPA